MTEPLAQDHTSLWRDGQQVSPGSERALAASFLNNNVTVRSSLCLMSELITQLVLNLSREQREPFLEVDHF